MPYEYILANLLAENEKAVGVLFLDDAGETVDLSCVELSPNEMRLLGAYVGIYLRQLQRFLEADEFGEVRYLHIENHGLHIYALPLSDGYFIVLAQRTPSITGTAVRSLERAGVQLMRELFPQ